jgi:uncharacterized protein YjbI with pentapeptide repeats
MSTPSTANSKSTVNCEVIDYLRPACAPTFYKEHQGRRYCVLHYPARDKEDTDFQREVRRKLKCGNFNFDGAVGSYLNFVTFDFARLNIPRVFKNASFAGAFFYHECDFSHVEFEGNTSFFRAVFAQGAIFHAVRFGGDVDFRDSEFKVADPEKDNRAADFQHATFAGKAVFSGSSFSKAVYFSSASFQGDAGFVGSKFAHSDEGDRSLAVAFNHATFCGDADFSQAIFYQQGSFYKAAFNGDVFFRAAVIRRQTVFTYAVFEKALLFERYLPLTETEQPGLVFEPGSFLDLQYARFEKPGQVVFQEVALRPCWFVNVDARKFLFTSPRWPRPILALRWVDEDLEALRIREVSHDQDSLAVACQRLAVNADENQRYEDASAFRFVALDLHRRGTRFGGLFWRLEWWYWFASGYSERLFRAIAILACIWLAFGAAYRKVDFLQVSSPRNTAEAIKAQATKMVVVRPLDLRDALVYSAAVVTLQKPEPKPVTLPGEALVLLETVIGPVQAALLVLAVRRRFMHT